MAARKPSMQQRWAFDRPDEHEILAAGRAEQAQDVASGAEPGGGVRVLRDLTEVGVSLERHDEDGTAGDRGRSGDAGGERAGAGDDAERRERGHGRGFGMAHSAGTMVAATLICLPFHASRGTTVGDIGA
jgi:hypothetical protein